MKSIYKDLKEKRGSRPKSKLWIPITRKTAKREFKLSRDSSTPAITGQVPLDNSTDEESDSSAEEEELTEHIYIETSDFFEKMTESEEGRLKFMTWLFKLVDIDKSGELGVDNLSLLVQALRQDGIDPEELTYDNDLKQSLPDMAEEEQNVAIAEQLIVEYGNGEDDTLTEREFDTLAKLILKNYELLYEEVETSQCEKAYKLTGYSLKRKIGRGSVGDVRLAVEHKTGIRKAIKIVPKGNVSDLSRLDTEIKAMMMLHHERILKLEQVFESETEVYFIMELCGGGSLSEYLVGLPLSENLVRYYFSQIISGVCYCHSKGVAHRDLKLDNILLDNNANIKITDFGHAGIYKKGWDIFATPLVGSICHVAPEQINGMAYSGEKHDMWSLGIILYTLLVGSHPFKVKAPHQLLEDIKNVNYTIPNFLSSEAADLISSLLVASSDDRPTCREVAKHPWFLSGKVDAPLLNSFTLPVSSATWKKMGACVGMCCLLKDLDIEPVYHEDAADEEHQVVKCHWIEKDVKFHFRLKEIIDDNEIFEFKLGSGGSKDFLSLMPKLRSRIAKRTRRKNKGKIANSEEDYEAPQPQVVPLELLQEQSKS